ncbi:uncharacterized protein LOC132624383 [Lycium barbarum]|uniref:uncharacterized protein LOC132624383 n=1 Tax=Lycium barbarum TaxID=112863 RepID=UPI00293EA84E|nr:uncharacterized protein LOC132624383 [Lycium barbarum]
MANEANLFLGLPIASIKRHFDQSTEVCQGIAQRFRMEDIETTEIAMRVQKYLVRWKDLVLTLLLEITSAWIDMLKIFELEEIVENDDRIEVSSQGKGAEVSRIEEVVPVTEIRVSEEKPQNLGKIVSGGGAFVSDKVENLKDFVDNVVRDVAELGSENVKVGLDNALVWTMLGKDSQKGDRVPQNRLKREEYKKEEKVKTANLSRLRDEEEVVTVLETQEEEEEQTLLERKNSKRKGKYVVEKEKTTVSEVEIEKDVTEVNKGKRAYKSLRKRKSNKSEEAGSSKRRKVNVSNEPGSSKQGKMRKDEEKLRQENLRGKKVLLGRVFDPEVAGHQGLDELMDILRAQQWDHLLEGPALA